MLSVIFGAVSIVAGVLWLLMWGALNEFVIVIQGALPPFMILVGLVAVAAGVSSIKDNIAAKKEEEKLESEPKATEEPAAPQDNKEKPL